MGLASVEPVVCWDFISWWRWLSGYWVRLAARSAWRSQLYSVQSALLAELFLEEGDGPISLQSRRSGGPRMAGHPSRRSLPSSQKSKKSISSQVWGWGRRTTSWPRTSGAGVLHKP